MIFDRIKEVLPLYETESVLRLTDRLTRLSKIKYVIATLERDYRNAAKMVQFIREARLLADPQLTHQDEIVSGDSFEDFWRTLCYYRTGRDVT